MMIDQLNILNPTNFYHNVEELVYMHDIPYMEAVCIFCEKNNIEIETAAEIIQANDRIKTAIQHEGEDRRWLPKTARLPI